MVNTPDRVSAPIPSTYHLNVNGNVFYRRSSINDLLLQASKPTRPSLRSRCATTDQLTAPSQPPSPTPQPQRSRSLSDIFIRWKRPSLKLSKRKGFSSKPSDYNVLETLGSGGTAAVYSAKHLPTDTVIAIKKVDLEQLDMNKGDEWTKRLDSLRREIQIMKLCRHPHLLPTYQSFVVSTDLYIVMPLMSAGSCRDLLTRFFPNGLDLPIVGCILKQVVAGLCYLHDNNLVHRDIKAANLMLDWDSGVVKLGDFGVSNYLLANQPNNTTVNSYHQFLEVPTAERKSGSCRSFVGTPCWMAPEILQRRPYDSKVDIWALGITTMELITGWPPYCEFEPVLMFSHIVHGPVPTLDEQRCRNGACRDFVSNCLRKQPQERMSAREAAAHVFIVDADGPVLLAECLQQFSELDLRTVVQVQKNSQQGR